MKKLQLANNIFSKFEELDIKYCHWKSNEHLLEGLAGVTDLDILIEHSKRDSVENVLSDFSFKRFESIAPYPFIEDYIGVDEQSGNMIHLHLHYKLILGEKFLKGYHIPWENQVLKSAVFDKEHNIFRSSPEHEIILLLIRLTLKVRNRDFIFEKVGKRYIDKYTIEEIKWLKKRIKTEKLDKYCSGLLGSEYVSEINLLIDKEYISVIDLSRFHKKSEKVLNQYSLYTQSNSWYLKKKRELKWIIRSIIRRYFSFKTPKRRIDPNGGKIIAIIGADGSGKSTVVKEIQNWLIWKIDVMTVYFGSGDGKSSMIRLPMKITNDLLNKKRIKKKTNRDKELHNNNSESGEFIKKVKNFGKIPWSLALAREKNNKIRLVKCLVNNGITVITDRYPQVNVKGYNDGPLLSYQSGIFSYLSKWENSIYENAVKNPPDLLIKLDVSPGVAVNRKPNDVTLIEAEKKAEAVKKINFKKSRVVVIDADQELEKVIVQVKNEIWKCLNEK